MAHFEIKNLSFYYPAAPKKAALDDVSLKIEQGEYVTVCGRSGSGKTTLLKHLKSVLVPHGKLKGEIFFQGKDLKLLVTNIIEEINNNIDTANELYVKLSDLLQRVRKLISNIQTTA